MRELIAAALAVLVIAVIYAGGITRRSRGLRLGLALLVAALVIAGGPGPLGTPTTVATLPTRPVPLTEAELTTTLTTDQALDGPVVIAFSTPMDAASVAAAIEVEPGTRVRLDWDAAARELTITPTRRWAPDTFHTITVQPGALARTGRPLTSPVRAAFLTRTLIPGHITASRLAGERTAVDSAFSITVQRPVDPASVEGALSLDPPVEGSIEAISGADGTTRLVFQPSESLAADTRYTVTAKGLRALDGTVLAPMRLTIITATAPEIVRLRPRPDTEGVPRDATISVRFTEAMDRASLEAALAVTVGDTAIKGTTRFAEGDTVVVVEPTDPLPYGTTIDVSVDPGASSAAGTPLAAGERSSFRVEPKPAPAPVRTSSPTSSGGGATGSGSWAAVERYYLDLMNCTRTGGWVSSTGACTSPGGRNVAPLKLHSGISSKVARPYAKLLATRNACSHVIGGNPGDRLARAGYTSYRWAENLGCRSGDPKKAVLGSHLHFQSEKSYNGGHYVNMMSTKYSHAGIGVWVASGRVRLVVDFYHP